jgi:DNA-binding SARP family transcriptional activator
VPLPKFGLTLLGRFELLQPDGPVELPNKKLAALLAYMACTAPEPQSREKLATLLWGSHFEAQARQNLRQALFRLRRALGEDVLISDGEDISLAPGTLDCDVMRCKALVREGSRASLAAAVDLYKGRFLSDVNIPEDAWADWVAGERQRLEGSALDALVRLGEIELVAGDADSALATAHRALAINNLREDAHRLIVQALAAAGRKAEALKHYQDLVALLKRELSAEPDAATKLLVADLRSTQPPSRSPTVKEIAKEPAKTDRPSIAVPPFADTRRSFEHAAKVESPPLAARDEAPAPYAQPALPVHCAARAGCGVRAGQQRQGEARQARGSAQVDGEEPSTGSRTDARGCGSRPARNASGRNLLVQARAGAGRRLRHDAQEPAPAVACEHR